MDRIPTDQSGLIKVITSPLGFFALSLLIVEGFLTIVLIFSDLEQAHKFWGMIIGAALFFLVVLGVWWLVKSPDFIKNLTFGEHGHLEEHKMLVEEKKLWGTSENPQKKSQIEGESISRLTQSSK